MVHERKFMQFKNIYIYSFKTNGGKKKNPYRIFVGKPEGNRPLGRRRWENNIQMGLREIGWSAMYWNDLAQDRDKWRALVNMVIKFRIT
jgi:hypothetical protein